MAPFVSAAGGTTNSSGEVWTDGPGNATDWSRHGVDIDDMYTLWSGDNESRSTWMFFDDSDIQSYLTANGITGQDAQDILAIREAAAGADIDFLYPPGRLVQRWNENDIGAYSLATSDQTSYAPQGKSVTDGQFIKNAFITEHSVTHMTIARVNGSSERRMIGPDGEANVLVDYLIDVPAESGSVSGSGRISWRLIDSNIETVRVSDGTCPIDDPSCAFGYGPNTHVSEIPYAGVRSSDGQFVYEANISVEMERKKVDRYSHSHCVSACGTPNATSARHSHTRTRYTTVTESIIVRETRPVEVNTLFTMSTAFAEYPNGDYVMYVDSNGRELWSGAVTENTSVGISSGLAYYTHRDTRWDTLTRYTDTGATSVEPSSVHPVRIYAFPAERGPERYAFPKDVGEILAYSEVNKSTPELHPNVSVRLASGNFSVGQNIVYRFDPWANIDSLTEALNFVSSKGERVEVRGVVYGERIVIPEETVQLNETNISMEVLGDKDPSTGSVPVLITLTDNGTGEPINLNASKTIGGFGGLYGYGGSGNLGNGQILTSDGQEVYTNSSGQVMVNIDPDSSGYLHAEYVPRPWWEIETSVSAGSVQPYLPSKTAVQVPTNLSGLVELVLPLVVIFGLIFGLTRLLGNTVGYKFRIGQLILRFFGRE